MKMYKNSVYNAQSESKASLLVNLKSTIFNLDVINLNKYNMAKIERYI